MKSSLVTVLVRCFNIKIGMEIIFTNSEYYVSSSFLFVASYFLSPSLSLSLSLVTNDKLSPGSLARVSLSSGLLLPGSNAISWFVSLLFRIEQSRAIVRLIIKQAGCVSPMLRLSSC